METGKINITFQSSANFNFTTEIQSSENVKAYQALHAAGLLIAEIATRSGNTFERVARDMVNFESAQAAQRFRTGEAEATDPQVFPQAGNFKPAHTRSEESEAMERLLADAMERQEYSLQHGNKSCCIYYQGRVDALKELFQKMGH